MEKFLFATSLLTLTTFDGFGFSICSCKSPRKAVGTPWEIWEWTEGGVSAILPKFPLNGVWLQSVAPFWQKIPWVFEDLPRPFFQLLKLEARVWNWKHHCDYYWETWLWRLLQYCCKFCLGTSLGALMEALNKDTFQVLDSAML